MAETKRIELTNVGALKKDKKSKEETPTQRFNLTLAESNDKTCPEFNYNELLKSVLGNDSKNGTTEVDPLSENDADDEKLKALARKFEEKYAPKPGMRNKLGQLEDYIDLGMGYDETDPFIDNTDAYDELVPSTLTTQYGGFYINSGKLDFKEVNTESSDDDIIDAARRKKRHKLKELEKDARKKRRLMINDRFDGEIIPKRRGRKPLDCSPPVNDGALFKPKKKQETVAVLLQQRKAQQQQFPQSSLASTIAASTSTTPLSKASPSATLQQLQNLLPSDIGLMANLVEASGGDEKQLKSSINEIIESVIITSHDRDSNGQEMLSVATAASVSSDSDNPPFVAATDGEVVPKLPEGLPETLDELIKQIKVAALKSGEGKCRFFSNEINGMLLSIDQLSRELPCSQRSLLFAHLASHLPCTKETLMKRAKKLRLDQENGKLHDLLRKLQMAICGVMPAMEELHKKRCEAFGKGITQVDDSSDSDNDCSSEEGFSSADEDNLDGGATVVKKKFVWNDKMRMLLCDIVQIKMKCFEMLKTRTQSAEEYLRQFFDMYVRGLWPKGWMRSRKLMKESRLVHAHLTFKPKKSVMLAKKAGGVQSLTQPTVSSGSVLPKCEPNFDASGGSGTTQKTTSSSVIVVSPSPPTICVSPRETPPPIRTVSPAQHRSDHSVLVTVSRSAPSPAQDVSATIQSPVTDSPSKLSGHVFSLLDPALIKNALPESASTSTAKDFLSEIISGALANFPNSSTVNKHSAGRDKFHESSLYTSAMNKCALSTATAVSSRLSGSAFKSTHVSDPGVESKVSFAVPKSVSKVHPTLTMPGAKGDSFTGSGGVSILKDHDRHSSVHQHWPCRNSPQDLRTPVVKTSIAHSAGTLGSASKKTTPLKLDMFMSSSSSSDCGSSLTSKISSAVSVAPYHSLYDIQGAIERGLKAQTSAASSACSDSLVNHVTTKLSRSLLASQQPLLPPPTSSYYPADLPLNFSTPRPSERSSSGHVVSTSARITIPAAPHTYSLATDRSVRSSSPSVTPSVRTVLLPQPKSNKHLGSLHRPKRDPQAEYLEGIAATFHEQHVKKSHRSTADYAAPSLAHRRGGQASEAISLSNHTPLTGTSSSGNYGEPAHPVSQSRSNSQVIRTSCAAARRHPS